MRYQKRRQAAVVGGRGWLMSPAARPPGPSTLVSKRAKWPGNERAGAWQTRWSRRPDLRPLTPPGTGWAELGFGVASEAQGPLPALDPPASVPSVWSTGGCT